MTTEQDIDDAVAAVQRVFSRMNGIQIERVICRAYHDVAVFAADRYKADDKKASMYMMAHGRLIEKLSQQMTGEPIK